MSTAKTPEGPPASVLIDQHITDLNDVITTEVYNATRQ